MAIKAPDESPQVVPSVREQSSATVDTFGGGAGLNTEATEINQIAQQTGEIAALEKVRADQTAVEEAQANASKLTTDVLYDPETGVLASRGTNALQAQKDGMKRFQSGMNQISMGLNGGEQVGAFNKWALAQGTVVNQHMMTHVDQQLKEHDAGSFKYLLENQAGLAALSHGNPDALKLSFDTVNDNAIAFAKRNRLDPDQTKELVQNSNDKMHASVIDGMLKFQSDDSADRYFEANKDNMSPAVREKMAVALQEGNVRNRSAMMSVNIWKETGGNLAQSFGEAEKIQNPEVQEMTRQRLRQLQADKIAAQDADQNEKYQQAWGLVKKASLNGSAVKLQDVVPPVLWTSLDPKNQENLKKLAFNNETNAQKWTDFSLMQPTSLKAITAQEMQQEWLPNFAPKDRDKAMKMWQSAQSDSKDSYLNSQQSHMIADMGRTIGVAGLSPGDPNKPGHDPRKLRGDSAADYHSWNTTAQQAIINFETTKLGGARKASQEETQQILDNLVVQRIGQKSFMGLPYGGKNIYATPYEDIPEIDKTKIEAFAQQRGVKATKEKVQQAYFYLQQKDKQSAIQVLSK